MTTKTKAKLAAGEFHMEVLLSIDRSPRDPHRIRFAVLKDAANAELADDAAVVLEGLLAGPVRTKGTNIDVVDNRPRPAPRPSPVAPAAAEGGTSGTPTAADKPQTFEQFKSAGAPVHGVIKQDGTHAPIVPRLNPTWTKAGAQAANAADEAAALTFAAKRASVHTPLRAWLGAAIPKGLHGANGVLVLIIGAGASWALWGAIGAIS